VTPEWNQYFCVPKDPKMSPPRSAHPSKSKKGKKRKGLPPRLAKHGDVLSVLSKAPSPMRKQMIQSASKEVIDTVCECCLNVLKGTVPLSPHQKKCLGKHRHVLRQMVQKKIPIRQKKKMLVQRGGILPLLLGPLLKGIAGTMLGGLFGAR
jgi:hypothetical protein